eukprot:1152873-Pyramimonas_sp.AAC.1
MAMTVRRWLAYRCGRASARRLARRGASWPGATDAAVAALTDGEFPARFADRAAARALQREFGGSSRRTIMATSTSADTMMVATMLLIRTVTMTTPTPMTATMLVTQTP